MEVKDLHSVDTKLQLLAGMPIEIEGIGKLAPYTIREIAQLGYSVYAQRLQTLTLDVNKALGDKPELANIELNAFDLFTHIGDDSYKSNFVLSMKHFLREDKFLHTFVNADSGERIDIIILGVDKLEDIDPDTQQRIIHRENFKIIVEALKLQNGLAELNLDKEYNAMDKRAKAILEKLKKSKETVKEVKKKQNGSGNDDIDVADIVSAVASKSNSVSAIGVWDLTLYQLYDHFKRLEMISQYDINIMAIMNGAEDIDLKHWSGRLGNDD